MEELSALCRCCLSTGAQASILQDEDIRSKFYETTTIEVKEEDGLPQGLCEDCLSVMNSAHQFKKQCLRIDSELKVQINNLAQADEELADSVQPPLDDQIPGPHLENEFKDLKLPPNVMIKSEPAESDDDCYYVLVIDDSKKKSLLPIKEEPKELNPATGELEFEKSVDSFLVKHKDKKTKDETFDMPDNDVEQYTFSEDQDTNDSEEQLELHGGTLISNGEGNIIKILTSNGTENLLFKGEKGDEIVTYIVEDNLVSETDDLSQEEVIVCEGDDSQFQILNCDGSELVIEYADNGQITNTVMRQSNGKYLCSCGLTFADFDELENHQSTHNPDAESHLCTLCGKGFESNEILTGHMLLHTNSGSTIACPFCEAQVKRNTLTQHIKYNHNNIKPQCALCHKTFANPNNLKRHMTTHSGVRAYQCDVCSKRFQQKITLQTHKLTHTSNRELSECESATEALEVKNLKGKTLCYPCHVCHKIFSAESALKYHVDNAHDDKPLELLCSECGEVLPNRRAMDQHVLLHRPDVKYKHIRRFECSVCGKNCSSQAMLIMHERVHTNERPFQCPLCALRFKTKTHLRTHQLTHTREKRFGCSVCMKFFALKGNLVVHLRTHTGERPYVCSICNEAFIDSKYLKKHKQRKHLISNMPWNQY